MVMNGPAISSGMGSCGLVWPIVFFTGLENEITEGVRTVITSMDWIGLALIAIILPAVLCPIINMFFRKIGWVKDGDLTLS